MTKLEIENVLKTLPIDFYSKRHLKVELSDDTNSSYFDPMKDEIKISYQQLSPLYDITDSDKSEQYIRSMLYHEVSHALLTTRVNMTSIINIFEDERIESILANYYMNVDFKALLNLICGSAIDNPVTAEQYFFNVVRFRSGLKEHTDKVHELIMKYRYLTREPSFGWTSYKIDVNNLYADCEKYFKQQHSSYNPLSMEQPDNQSTNSESENQISENQTNEIENQTDENQTNETENQTNEIESQINETEISNDQISENRTNESENQTNETEINRQKTIEADNDYALELILSATAENNEDKQFDNQIQIILASINKTSNRSGSSTASYSGRFNTKQIIRTDYKWWNKAVSNGPIKAVSKIKLNLFIDVSGSYQMNEDKTNKLIKSLIKFENASSNFSFDVITTSIGSNLLPKSDRFIKCHGGTYLKPEIRGLYQKVQSKDAMNFNIVLFDGDAFFSSYRSSDPTDYSVWSIWDNKSSYIISDKENEKYINRYCKNCGKVIISDNYTSELYNAVLNVLNIFKR